MTKTFIFFCNIQLVKYPLVAFDMKTEYLVRNQIEHLVVPSEHGTQLRLISEQIQMFVLCLLCRRTSKREGKVQVYYR